jgi:hypothetical protein
MSKDASATRMEKITSLCKRRGFIFQSSEIYGGLNGFWDFGPLGVELKKNLKDFWWRRNVRERDDMEGMDGSIIMNRAVWKASGHEETFSDRPRRSGLDDDRRVAMGAIHRRAAQPGRHLRWNAAPRMGGTERSKDGPEFGTHQKSSGHTLLAG